ncbi:MAG: 50S ribosomal protein L18a [Desulfurococcales archaeon]|nr:50S ribosomal protein L18a [Desulfurococcales archaeon]
MSEVKIFRVTGRMLLSPDKFPEWRKFAIEVRALNEEQAKEKVYSELGSRHKLKRTLIKIEDVKEISLEEATSPYIHHVAALKGWDPK